MLFLRELLIKLVNQQIHTSRHKADIWINWKWVKLVCLQKKKKKVRYTFNLSKSCLVQLKISAHRHIFTYIFNILKNFLLIVVLICHLFSFLSLKENFFSRNKKLMGCCACIPEPSVEWMLTCQAIWECSSRYFWGSDWEQIPFWKQMGYDTKKQYHPQNPVGQHFQYDCIWPCLTASWKSTVLHWTEVRVTFGVGFIKLFLTSVNYFGGPLL